MYKPYSVYHKTMIAIAFTLILPTFAAVAVISHYSISTIERQSYTTNVNLLQKTSKIVDTILGHINQIMQQTCNDRIIIQSLVAPHRNDTMNNSAILSELRSISVLNEYVESVYLYRAYEKDVLTSDGEIYRIDDFYDQEWLTSYNETFIGTKQLKRRTIQDDNGNQSRCITLIHNVPFYTWSKIGGIIINLDADRLYDLIDLNDQDSGEIYVIDQDGDLVLNRRSISNKVSYYLGFNSLLRFNLGYKQIRLENESNLLVYTTSDYNYWRYIYIVPLDELRGGVRTVSIIIYFVSMIYVITALSATFLVSNGLYRPVKRLLSTFSINTESKTQHRENEYQLIDNAYKAIMTKNEGMREELDLIEPLVRERLLADLLNKTDTDWNENTELLDYVNIYFPYKNFLVILAGIDDYKKFLNDCGNNIIREQKRALTYFADDLVKSYYAGFCFEDREDTLAIIFNFKQHEMTEIIKREIEDFILEVNKKVNKEFTFSLTFGIGSLYVEMENIHCSYCEAEIALRYKMFIGKNQTIYYQDVCKTVGDGSLYFYENNLSLINSLGAGSLEGVNRIIDEIIDYPRRCEEITRSEFIREVSIMVHMLLGFLVKRGIASEKIFGADNNPFVTIEEFETLEELEQWMRLVYARVVEEVKSTNEYNIDKYLNVIVDYIDRHYQTDISLHDMASHLNLSSTYTSKVFKDTMGCTFTEYLSRFRIKKAKELLKNNSLSIKQIGFRVGFNNIYTFLRTFKKIENVSPGQFRSLI